MNDENIERLNLLLQSFDECRIESFDGSQLVIIGCWDLCYHHNFEVEFGEVIYLQCPTYFCAQKFRLASPTETSLFNVRDYCDDKEKVFCFESDDDNFFIIAQSLALREGLVLHYKRET